MKCNLSIYLLIIIVERGKGAKAAHFLQDLSIPVQMIISGRGTASSKIMDYLGLEEPHKEILFCLTDRSRRGAIFHYLEDKMHLSRPGHGIACALPLSGITRHLSARLEHAPGITHLTEEERNMKESIRHELIFSIMDAGISSTIMEAAKEAGCKGGTVIKARSLYTEEIKKIFGMTLQQEKEILLILVPVDLKLPVMEAISKRLLTETGEHGIVFSLPAHDTMGLL